MTLEQTLTVFFGNKKFPDISSLSWLHTLHFWLILQDLQELHPLLLFPGSFHSIWNLLKLSSSLRDDTITHPKGSPWPRHLKEDRHFGEERTRSKMLWACPYVLPFLKREQLFLHYFIFIHTKIRNKFLQQFCWEFSRECVCPIVQNIYSACINSEFLFWLIS